MFIAIYLEHLIAWLKLIMNKEQESTSDRTVTPSKYSRLAWLVPIYIFSYSLAGIWALVDGLLTNFSFILKLWAVEDPHSIPTLVNYLIFTMIGALFGSAILGIISFHRYIAIDKSFDPDHLWGFWFSPLLALLVGILIFAIIQSGLVVLSGDLADAKNPENATLGYLAIGGIAGYNWDVFVKKLQNLSKNVLNAGELS